MWTFQLKYYKNCKFLTWTTINSIQALYSTISLKYIHKIKIQRSEIHGKPNSRVCLKQTSKFHLLENKVSNKRKKKEKCYSFLTYFYSRVFLVESSRLYRENWHTLYTQIRCNSPDLQLVLQVCLSMWRTCACVYMMVRMCVIVHNIARCVVCEDQGGLVGRGW